MIWRFYRRLRWALGTGGWQGNVSARLPWPRHRTASASQAGDKSFSQHFEGMKFLSSGQQLLVGPTGYGQCGCIQNPVHVTMGDNDTCHPLYHQVTRAMHCLHCGLLMIHCRVPALRALSWPGVIWVTRQCVAPPSAGRAQSSGRWVDSWHLSCDVMWSVIRTESVTSWGSRGLVTRASTCQSAQAVSSPCASSRRWASIEVGPCLSF